MSGQPWAYHEVLQGQIHPLPCAARVAEPELGAAASRAGGLQGVRVCHFLVEFFS